jgi:hypothetical protein
MTTPSIAHPTAPPTGPQRQPSRRCGPGPGGSSGWIACLAGLSGLALAGTCPAQLQDGRLLDRNPQVGSGGRNTPVQDFMAVQRFNEAVIAGTAPGGKSFRGFTGYRGADEFTGGPTAGSSTFEFRRDTAPQGLIGTGVRSSDILATQFALSTGRVTDFNPSLMFALQPVRDATAASGSTLRSLRSIADYTAAEARRPTLLAMGAGRDGTLTTVTSSSLRGLSINRIPAQDPASAARLGSPTGLAGGPAGGPAGPTTGPITAVRDPREPDLGGRPAGNIAAASPLTTPPSASLPGQTPPGRIDLSVPVVRTSLDDLVSTLRTTTAGRPAPAAPEGPAGPAPARPGATTPAPPPPLGSPEEERAFRDRLAALRARLAAEQAAGMPSESPSAPADWRAAILGERITDAGLRRELERLGVRVPQPAPAAPEAPMMPPPEAIDLRDPALIEALRQAAENPPVRELIPADAPPDAEYTILMRNAARDMAEGRFFDAEATYERAVRIRGLDRVPGGANAVAMARAGRLNAQLGAGLFLSSALSLRTLLRDHPEIAPLRYDASLLMSERRAENIVEYLTESRESGTALGADAGWCIAYLGFQFARPDWLARGLAELERALPTMSTADRALVEFVRQVWRPEAAPSK